MSPDDNPDRPDATVFGWTTRDWALFVSGFAIVAGTIGAAVPLIAGWASRFPTPVQEIFELADSFDWRIAVAPPTREKYSGRATDARKVQFSLTEPGERAAAVMRARLEDALVEHLREWGDQDRAEFARLFEQFSRRPL